MVLIFVQGVEAASFYLVFNEIKDTADNPTRRDAPKKGVNKNQPQISRFFIID